MNANFKQWPKGLSVQRKGFLGLMPYPTRMLQQERKGKMRRQFGTMRKCLFIFPVLALCLTYGFRAHGSQPTVFSAVGQFSSTSNPNGTWSYGYSETLGGAFHLYTQGGSVPGADPTRRGWFLSPGPGPWVTINDYLSFVNLIELLPGASAPLYTIVRWTAPSDGEFDVLGTFVGDRSCTTSDVHVLRNGTSVFDGTIKCVFEPSVFHVRSEFAHGDTIDFVVGVGADGNNFNDDTGLQVTISAVGD